MKQVEFIRPEIKYIDSYWEMFDTVAREGKYLASDHAFPQEDTRIFLEHCIEENVPYLFVRDPESDRIVGWCDAQMCGEGIAYMGVGLLAAYREQGIGKKLISAVLDLAKRAGFHLVELDVRASNTRAIHVYQTLGFRITKVKKNAFTLKDITEDVCRMEKNEYVT